LQLAYEYALVRSIGRFACGSKVCKRFILPDFCPQGKNLEGKEGKYRRRTLL